MLVAKITVTGTQIRAEKLVPITSGMVGATVEVTFDESWDGYSKVYVWNYRNVTIDDLSATGTIPAEVLERPGGWLRFGVYGTKDGCALPTLWVTIGSVDPGADPSGGESTDPSLPVWAELRAEMEELKKKTDLDVLVVSADEDTLITDKSDTEVMEAYVRGRNVLLDLGDTHLPLFAVGDVTPYFMFLIDGAMILFKLEGNQLSQEYSEFALQEDIPTDEHINGLIDTALGVIENGTY